MFKISMQLFSEPCLVHYCATFLSKTKYPTRENVEQDFSPQDFINEKQKFQTRIGIDLNVEACQPGS